MGRRLGAALVVAIALCGLAAMRGDARGTELLGTWEVPTGIGIDREPYSAPPTLWLYWGSTTNRRMEGSGENIRHLFKLGRIEGGEYRDPQFLNKIDGFLHKIDGVLFKQLSTACCTSLVMPPFEWDWSLFKQLGGGGCCMSLVMLPFKWDFPVHNANKEVGQALLQTQFTQFKPGTRKQFPVHNANKAFPVHNANKAVGQALRSYVANGNALIMTETRNQNSDPRTAVDPCSYVANGNALIMTGGLIDIEFLNRYFSLNLEPARVTVSLEGQCLVGGT
ncbi:hypothetical protein T484DRAFT_1771046 [Baffinella frigidus]|nr:hypothetical protein T484DRAFT_1771046 [Cryptophyta sp. CCMP2293]